MVRLTHDVIGLRSRRASTPGVFVGFGLCWILTLQGCNSPELGESEVIASLSGPRSDDGLTKAGVQAAIESIRELMQDGMFREADSAIEQLLELGPSDEIADGLARLSAACRQSLFVLENPFELKADHSSNDHSLDGPLKCSFWIENLGERSLELCTEESSFWTMLGLAKSSQAALVTTLTVRTLSPEGSKVDQNTRVQWMSEDVVIPPRERRQILASIDVQKTPQAVVYDVALEATLKPIGFGVENGELFYIPLEFPKETMLLFEPDVAGVIIDPNRSIDESLASNDPRRLLASLMACDELGLALAVDHILAVGSQLTPELRRTAFLAFRTLLGVNLGLDLDRWRGWWASEGRDDFDRIHPAR